ASGSGLECSLSEAEIEMDKVLEALYDSDRKAGLGSSSPQVHRWLGDIRTYFPASVVQVMQKDALERLNLQQMLLEKETLETVVPDVHLVSTLLTLKNVIPQKTKETARQVVRAVVRELEKRLRNPMVQAIRGVLSRATRNSRPRAGEIHWHRTIQKNLKHYIPDQKTVIAEKLVGYGRKQSALRDILLCVDQSGSMAASVVYSSIFAAVLASLRAVTCRMVVFDTSVVDLTDKLADPVDVLFGTQLGGGTDIHQAITYCQQQITRPSQTLLILISDLIEGGDQPGMIRRMGQLVQSGVQVIGLLSLSDDGKPSFDEQNASLLHRMGIPCFACTPDQFPGLMATALERKDLASWAARQEIVLQR
ncbi:MAG TPA: VWA domain-containing protein, partial [Gemmatales bacterium]|nr:VWA domain-containing protein [Gemmatales bacterium]